MALPENVKVITILDPENLSISVIAVVDVRRDNGYSALKYLDPDTGYGAIPKAMAHQYRDHVRGFVKKGGKYLKVKDWPITFITMPIVPFLEILGFVNAIHSVKEISNHDCKKIKIRQKEF